MTTPAGAIHPFGLALQGRHAVVTGGGSGIGAAVALALLDAGARVTLMGRDVARLEARCAEWAARGDVKIVAVDLTHALETQQAFVDAMAASGEIDVLINNAGAAESGLLAKSDDAMWMRMLEVNLMSAVRASREVLPGMQARGWGRIVNIASTAGLTGYAYVSAYCAAKHAMVGMTRALALEVARQGITVNAVCPGYTDTDLLTDAIDNIRRKTGRDADAARADLARANPQGRLVTPDEVAATVRWLCLPESSAMNGQSLAVCGGELM